MVVKTYKWIKEVDCGDGAIMTIENPASFEDGGMSWRMRYGSPDSKEDIKYQVSSTLDSYDYLLSGHINQKEAIRRLKLLRKARKPNDQ